MTTKAKDINRHEQVNFCSLKISQLRFECVSGKSVARKVPVHYHESLCIGLITKGHREMIIDNKTFSIKQNQLFIINPYEPHTIQKTEPHDYRVLTVHGKWNKSNFKNLIHDPEAIILFRKCCKSLKCKNEISFNSDWEMLYSHLLLTHTNKPLQNKCICMDKATGFMKAHYQNPIRLDDIAREVALSRYHFCRQFSQQMGISPYNYLRQYRLCKSFQMLRKNYPVGDVAIETGFYDSSHFIRAFETFMMISPKQYQTDLNT